MKIAVIGAGIVGVTTAYELATDGHEVTVLERRASVASETSFANAGIIAPGYVTPWAAPGMPGKVAKGLFSAHAAVRLAAPPGPAMAGWLWRWWRACDKARYEANRRRMHRLAHYSRARLREVAKHLSLDYEQAQGFMVLLRGARELALARPGLALLAELGVPFHLIDADKARALEPGLNAEMELRAAVHLPGDEVGNCRQFAHLLRHEAQKLGVQFRFQRVVQAIVPGAQPQVRHVGEPDDAPMTGFVPEAEAAGVLETEAFDAVVVCAANDSAPLLAPLGVKLPLQAVYGYSITAPIRIREGYPEIGPKAGLMDERYKVAISRLGQRLRVAGSAEIGGRLDDLREKPLATLYKVLDDWFPGAARISQVQQWKGARPMLPDGPPVLGESGAAGVWLNLGHGSSGWALACGSARVLADRLVRREAAIDLEGLGIDRLRR